MSKQPVRVLVVDDSALMRKVISDALTEDPRFDVVGTAADPYAARDKIVSLRPDVLTLDIEMPRMDGLTFLRILMRDHPMPVVMISSLTDAGAEATLASLEYGAVDFVSKPKSDLRDGMRLLGDEIREKVHAASIARVRPLPKGRPNGGKASARSALRKAVNTSASHAYATTQRVLAIGASTGGTEAIVEVIRRLPADTPGTVITQHMPPAFTKSFAKRLNGLGPLEVREAADGDRLVPGLVLLAPGDHHIRIVRSGAAYIVHTDQGERVSGHRPSVDVMMESVAKAAGGSAVGVLLTGMGADGADGMVAIRKAGGRTIAQDEETCVVFGMPKEAIRRGGADVVLPLEDIAERAVELIRANAA